MSEDLFENSENSFQAEFPLYQQSIYRKISIAVALAVIRSKPKNLTLAEHVEKTKKNCFRHWQVYKGNVFEREILLFLQNKTLKDLDEKYKETLSLSAGDDEAFFKWNCLFLRCMAQLKHAIDGQKTIQLKTIRALLSDSETEMFQTFFSMQSHLCESGSVSTFPYRYITHSSETETLLSKCLDLLLGHVKNAVFTNTFTVFTNWKGSLTEKVFGALQTSMVEPMCKFTLIVFLQESIDEIWGSDNLETGFLVEHQCLMLVQLCAHPEVNSQIMETLIEKMKQLTNDTLRDSVEIHVIEKIPHFIQFLRRLLEKWVMPRRNEASLTDSDKKRLLEWKEVFQALFLACTNDYGIISEQIWSLVEYIDKYFPE